MDYISLNGNTHSGVEGIHLETVDCPTGCISITESEFVQSTKDDTQAAIDSLTSTNPNLKITITSNDPLRYIRTFGNISG